MNRTQRIILAAIVALGVGALVWPVPVDPKVSGSNPECFEWPDVEKHGCRYNATLFGAIFISNVDDIEFARVNLPGGYPGLFGINWIDMPSIFFDWHGPIGTGFWVRDAGKLGQFVFSCTYFGWTDQEGWFTDGPWDDICLEAGND